MLTHVIFDMDGTLLDTERCYFTALMEIASSYGLDDLEDAFRSSIGLRGEQSWKIIDTAINSRIDTEDFISQARKRAIELTSDRMLVKPGVLEVLTLLKKQKFPMAVATSSNTQTAKGRLGDQSLLSYFDVVVGGDLVDNAKPDPKIYELAAQKLGAIPPHCIAFEDSGPGVLSSVAAGCFTIYVPDINPIPKNIEKKCQYVASSISVGLREILPNLFD
ncbi:MAG: Phosphorylated carbohydrates phosphatase [Alphaproteobacteria bacterium MarineAlpha3_Bin7]|nr:MAG: Phosphorylated carbohydrates phosphatase [Alphaproteobacteria bacterium MarineAlpha3_Bin7]|tara:strand:- start:2368 stop:3024 length:657 start_codon:yes stop_codon:yes gene_type:complete